MSVFWRNVFILTLVVRLLSPVGGWALNLRQFGSCIAHLALFNTSQKYLDWTTNLVSTNPYMPWTITTKKPIPESKDLSIHPKRSLCTVNILMVDKRNEEKQLIFYANNNLNRLRPHMHSTFIVIREDSNRVPALQHRSAFRQSFRVIFAVISNAEENFSLYYFCPVCKNPMKLVHKNQLASLSNKEFRGDRKPLIIGVEKGLVFGPSNGLSDKRCLRQPIREDCVGNSLGTVELLSQHFNFSIFYTMTFKSAYELEDGSIHVNRDSNSFNPELKQPLDFIMKYWYFKYEGNFLFYCIPRNTTNQVQQAGIQTWVMVFETNFWVKFIIVLFLATLANSLSLQLKPFQFVKKFGDKCFYMFSAVIRQEIPSNQRAIWIFSFVFSLVLFVYENEFTSYVIVEKDPPPYRSSRDVIVHNYTVVYPAYALPGGSISGFIKNVELILNQLLHSKFLKSKNQFESRVVDTASKWQYVFGSALLRKCAVLDFPPSHLPLMAEWTHKMNWMNSDSVCYVTERDIIIKPLIWFPSVSFKFEFLETIVILEQTGIENFWRYRALSKDLNLNIMNEISKQGGSRSLPMTPHKRESGLVSMKQLTSMMMLCLGLMGCGGVIFFLEVVIGRPKEVVDFLYCLYCKIRMLAIRILKWSQNLERSWKNFVRGCKKIAL